VGIHLAAKNGNTGGGGGGGERSEPPVPEPGAEVVRAGQKRGLNQKRRQ